MLVERHHQGILVLGVHVIEQDPHAHAALCRLVQRLGHEVADQVVVPDVVLQVQAAPGMLGDHRAGGIGIQAVGEEGHAALAGMLGLQADQFAVDGGLLRLGGQHGAARAQCPGREVVGQQQAAQGE
ncbi:hypothetical protein D3C71_1432460 [compost metagenome]